MFRKSFHTAFGSKVIGLLSLPFKWLNSYVNPFRSGGFRMKFKFLAVILVLSMLFVIPGCAPKPLTCPANELQAAFLLYPPEKGRGISLTPTL